MDKLTRLPFGTYSLPINVTLAWGARWIWPDDQVFDRQSVEGIEDQDERASLLSWLNDEVQGAPRATARALADCYRIKRNENRAFKIYEDEHGVVIANPQKSSGYLYVAAYMYRHIVEPAGIDELLALEPCYPTAEQSADIKQILKTCHATPKVQALAQRHFPETDEVIVEIDNGDDICNPFSIIVEGPVVQAAR